MLKLEYKQYNYKYPDFFSNEKKVLEGALNTNVDIIHIGSTSISDLGGKEIIDIMITSPINDLKEVRTQLIKLNYQHNKNLSFGDREFFNKDKENNHDRIRIHLHLTFKNSPAYEKAVLFKKYLLTNKEEALKYQNLKKRAIKEAQSDYKKYRQIKNKYIDNLLKHI